MDSLRIAACQLNFHVGDLDGNRKMIIAAYRQAEAESEDIAILPELAVSSYPPEDLLLKSAFVEEVQKTLNEISAEVNSCVAVIGFVSGEEAAADPIKRTSNSAAICANGKIYGVYNKRALPDYGVFDEERYFTPGKGKAPIFEIYGVNVGVTICEDIWLANGVINELASSGAQVILNLNASPYEQGKIFTRQNVLQQRIKESKIPIVYVNQVGGQDELIFDGGSMAMNADGEIISSAPQFEESIMISDLELPKKPSSESVLKIPLDPKTYAPPKGQIEKSPFLPLEPLS